MKNELRKLKNTDMKYEYAIKIIEQEIERRQIILKTEQTSLIMCKDEPELLVQIIERLKSEINELKQAVKTLNQQA